ncbi:MAG: hypothetical protein ACNA78_07075 [Balneolaceae bacterium]
MEENILNDLNEELEDVLEEGRKALDDAELKERLEEIKTELELTIRKHPIQSVLVGAAAGYLLGKLFRIGR